MLNLGQEAFPFTRKIVLKAGVDLSETSTGTAQEFRATIPANSIIWGPVVLLIPPGPTGAADFPLDASDVAFDDITVSVGDSVATGNLIAATQIAKLAGSPIQIGIGNRLANISLGNVNGAIAALTISGSYSQSEVQALRAAAETLADDVRALAAAGQTAKLYTAADYIKIVVTPESGKALSNLDTGEINILVPLLTIPLMP